MTGRCRRRTRLRVPRRRSPTGTGCPVRPARTARPLTRRQYAYGLTVALVVLVLLLLGIFG
ncbi:hypothetical protein ACH4T9_26450 [Micromonospora sp. NPDC020750]|uniref:hypothetical protein n=1 Tax=unclassified Micromonospora TaxID=2617518 RepID=UPI0037A6AB6E